MPAYTQMDMPEHHVILLTAMLRLDQGTPLPAEIVANYWRAKMLADPVRMTLCDNDLLHIVLTAQKADGPVEKPAPDLAVMFRKKELRPDTMVYCQWQGKNNNKAKLLDVSGDGQLIVRFVGKTEEYRVPAEHVSLTPV